MGQVEFGAPIHLAIEQLEAVHLPVSLPLPSKRFEGHADHVIVLPDAFGERRQLADVAVVEALQPVVELSALALMQQHEDWFVPIPQIRLRR